MDNIDQLGESLLLLVILSMVIERALAVVFDMEKIEPALKRTDLKGPIAIVASLIVCAFMGFDVMNAVAASCTVCGINRLPTWLGIGITGFVVAGGSAGAVKLFQDVLGFRRSARDSIKEAARLEEQATKAEAEARIAAAQSEISKARATEQDLISQSISSVSGGSDARKQVLRLRLASRYHSIVTGQS